MKRLRLPALFLSVLLLTACGEAPAVSVQQQPVLHQLPESDLDLSFFRKPVEPEPEYKAELSPLYNTQIASADGVILAELTGGDWVLTEDGQKYKGMLETVTPDAVVGPDIRNTLRINTEKADACAQILTDAGIEGCVIVTDPFGQIDMICNSPAEKNYAAAPNFNGSTAKLLVSTAILDQGAEQEYDDPGFYNPGWHTYYNHDTTAGYGGTIHRDLLNAFTNSSNAYFMHAICELLTHDQVIETYNKYYGYNLFGNQKAGYYFPTDWMTLEMPDWENIRGNDFERGKSAIGLSDQVKITPLFLNAVTGAIASDGLYQLNLKADTDKHRLKEAEPLPKEIKEKMWELMKSTAAYTNQNALSPLEGYSFYIKTGTADTRYGEHNEHYLKRLLITGFLAKDGVPVRVITLYCHNGAEVTFGGNGGMAQFYRRIAELMLPDEQEAAALTEQAQAAQQTEQQPQEQEPEQEGVQ